MKLEAKAKPVRMRLFSGGEEHSSLESLRRNFSLADVAPLARDGRLSRWLAQSGQGERAAKIARWAAEPAAATNAEKLRRTATLFQLLFDAEKPFEWPAFRASRLRVEREMLFWLPPRKQFARRVADAEFELFDADKWADLLTALIHRSDLPILQQLYDNEQFRALLPASAWLAEFTRLTLPDGVPPLQSPEVMVRLAVKYRRQFDSLSKRWLDAAAERGNKEAADILAEENQTAVIAPFKEEIERVLANPQDYPYTSSEVRTPLAKFKRFLYLLRLNNEYGLKKGITEMSGTPYYQFFLFFHALFLDKNYKGNAYDPSQLPTIDTVLSAVSGRSLIIKIAEMAKLEERLKDFRLYQEWLNGGTPGHEGEGRWLAAQPYDIVVAFVVRNFFHYADPKAIVGVGRIATT